MQCFKLMLLTTGCLIFNRCVLNQQKLALVGVTMRLIVRIAITAWLDKCINPKEEEIEIMSTGRTKRMLQDLIDSTGLVDVICTLEEMTRQGKTPLEKVTEDGLHKTINAISVLLLQQQQLVSQKHIIHRRSS